MPDTGSGATKGEQADHSSVGDRGKTAAAGGGAPALRPLVARVTPCDPELKAYLSGRFGSELVERWLATLECSLVPDLGSLLNFVPADQRSRFLRFWVEEGITPGPLSCRTGSLPRWTSPSPLSRSTARRWRPRPISSP